MNVLEFLASRLSQDTPPPRLAACLDDPSEAVRNAAIKAVLQYRNGLETLTPAALRGAPREHPRSEEFTWFFARSQYRPLVVRVFIEGLSSQDVDVRRTCAFAVNHMGRAAGPALPAILNLIRVELERPSGADKGSPDILAMASGAVGEISPETPAQTSTVELLAEVAQRSVATLQKLNEGLSIKKPEPSAAQRLRALSEERLDEAGWSLGILGRSAAPAVPTLLSVLETRRDMEANTNRGLTALALAEITRGTPDEDSALAALANAWNSATPQEKPFFAQALRSFGPKADRLVPELKRFPPDGSRMQIRRVPYPRSAGQQRARE